MFSLSDIEQEIAQQQAGLEWQCNQASVPEVVDMNDGLYRNGNHGTRWCYIKLSDALIDKLEATIGCRVYRDTFYLWDYMEKKSLPLHLDGSDQNCGKAIACCVPLIGRFRLRTYMDLEMRTPVDECIYGPGELVLINNRKYYHDGLVLDDTRLAIHCFLDFENFRAESSLSEMLMNNSF